MAYGKYKAPKPLTKDDIMAIAQRRGRFTSSPRWRDDKVRGKCFELVKAGRLKLSPDYNKWHNQEFLYVQPTQDKGGE